MHKNIGIDLCTNFHITILKNHIGKTILKIVQEGVILPLRCFYSQRNKMYTYSNGKNGIFFFSSFEVCLFFVCFIVRLPINVLTMSRHRKRQNYPCTRGSCGERNYFHLKPLKIVGIRTQFHLISH